MPQSLLTGQLKEKRTYRVWCLYSSFVHALNIIFQVFRRVRTWRTCPGPWHNWKSLRHICSLGVDSLNIIFQVFRRVRTWRACPGVRHNWKSLRHICSHGMDSEHCILQVSRRVRTWRACPGPWWGGWWTSYLFLWSRLSEKLVYCRFSEG